MSSLMRWQRESPTIVPQIYNSFISFQNELDKMISDFNRTFDFHRFSSKEMRGLNISPSVDIVEDDKIFKIEAEMPGMGEEDIKISIGDGKLTLRGEKETSQKDENKNYLMREINYGCYERSIPLPEDVDIEKAKASFKKGMLWVTIPKKPGATSQLKELKIEKA